MERLGPHRRTFLAFVAAGATIVVDVMDSGIANSDE
jgi:hypothetical protein